MTQVPTEASVLADFDDAIVRQFGREFRFYREDEAYFMEMKAEDATRAFELVLSTGAHHQQAFWFATDQGRGLGQIPLIWITSEQRWVPYRSIFIAPPSRPSMQIGLWNDTCIRCHVVGGQPRFEEGVGYDSRVGEFGISCAACHGAAEEHVMTHRNPLNRYLQHLSSADDPTLVSPPDLSHERSSQVCGQCHSIFDFHDVGGERAFNRQGFPYRPGDDLDDTRHVFRRGQDSARPVVAKKLAASPDFFERRFWSDGMVRVSGREYNGLLETPCYQRGTLSCTSCHAMHGEGEDWADDQLKPGMRGNEACVPCHTEYTTGPELVRHTHHSAESSGSSCYNCHMPHTTLGLMKAMRSHTVDSPDVATTLRTGRPNACNLCHLDKTLDWTSKRLAEWYAVPAPTLDESQRTVASSVRWLLEGDAGQRAIAGWHYGWKPAQEASGAEWMGGHLAELLTDRYDVVRFIGYHSLRGLPGFVDLDYDYAGSETDRRAGQIKARRLWGERADRRAPSDPVLIDAEGAVIAQRVQQLRERRRDPPVFLAE